MLLCRIKLHLNLIPSLNPAETLYDVFFSRLLSVCSASTAQSFLLFTVVENSLSPFILLPFKSHFSDTKDEMEATSVLSL